MCPNFEHYWDTLPSVLQREHAFIHCFARPLSLMVCVLFLTFLSVVSVGDGWVSGVVFGVEFPVGWNSGLAVSPWCVVCGALIRWLLLAVSPV